MTIEQLMKLAVLGDPGADVHGDLNKDKRRNRCERKLTRTGEKDTWSTRMEADGSGAFPHHAAA